MLDRVHAPTCPEWSPATLTVLSQPRDSNSADAPPSANTSAAVAAAIVAVRDHLGHRERVHDMFREIDVRVDLIRILHSQQESRLSP